MNTYEIIKLIAEPDAEERLASIQRLASEALLPKPGTPIPKVTNFEKAFGGTYLQVDNQHKVLIDDGTVYKLYDSLPKAPTVKEIGEVTYYNRQSIGNFRLETSKGDIVDIRDHFIVQMYNKLPKAPVAEYKIKSFEKKNGFTVLELDSTDLVDISDKMVIDIYNKLPKAAPAQEKPGPDYKALITILDQFSLGIGSDVSPSELRREYKLWKKENM